MESIEGDEDNQLKSNEETNQIEKTESSEIIEEKVVNESNKEIIIKELKKVKKQNMITHCLLSTLIVLTLACQVSKVSLILRIKDGLRNPLKSVTGIIGGFFGGGKSALPEVKNIQEAINQVSADQKQVNQFPELKISEFTDLDLPRFDTTEED